MSPCTSKGTADSTTDADGNTVEPTDEENAAAKEKAIADADAALKRIRRATRWRRCPGDLRERRVQQHQEAGSNSGDRPSGCLTRAAQTATAP